MIKLLGHAYQGIYSPISSKSDAHRALILASLSKHEVTISNVYFSNDVKATINSLISLGAKIISDEEKNIVYVKEGIKFNNEATLNVLESGSTFRFLIPICSIFSKKTTFITQGRLSKRPLDVYLKIFNEQNIKFIQDDNKFVLEGSLKSGNYEVDGNISSQFITGLLLSLVTLETPSTIKINHKISSLDYILMSINTINKFGGKIIFNLEEKIIYVNPCNDFTLTNYEVEPDFSQAAFFMGLGVINGGIRIKNIKRNSFQPDKQMIDILLRLGANLHFENDDLVLEKSSLHGGIISLDACPDLGPILMGISSFSESPITLKDIERLRIKESDRVEAMLYNLNLLGVKYDLKDNEVTIYPSKIVYKGDELKSFNDHRIFMALKIILFNIDFYIDDAKCLDKSYPTFLLDLAKLERD